MNKRLSSLTALLLAALLLLAGCGKTPSASVPASSAPASSPSSDPASAPTGPTEPAAPAVPDLSKLDLPTFPDRNIYSTARWILQPLRFILDLSTVLQTGFILFLSALIICASPATSLMIIMIL